MTILYSVRDWDEHFENSESRKVRHCRYVYVPNKHDGSGYGRMMAHPEGERLFAAWNAIIQVASKMPERGVLRDRGGALSAADLAFKTRLKQETFELALEFFSSKVMGWLDAREEGLPAALPIFNGESGNISTTPPETSGDAPENLPEPPDILPIEGKGREGNRREGKNTPDAPSGKFRPPSLEEVTAYCAKRQNGIDPVAFLAHYAARKWKIKGTPIANWQACVITWERKRKDGYQNGTTHRPSHKERLDADALKFAEELGLDLGRLGKGPLGPPADADFEDLPLGRQGTAG